MKRVAWLDTVRVFSSLLVIISHYVICFEQFDFPIMREFFFHVGKVGVILFFAISGYLVNKSLARSSSLWNFYKWRAVRICVPFAAAYVVLGSALMILAILEPSLSDYSPFMKAIYAEGFPKILLAAIPHDVNFTKFFGLGVGVFVGEWFIGTIIWLYLLAPLLSKLIRRAPLVTFAASILISLVTFYAAENFAAGKIICGWWIFSARLPEFLLGMILAIHKKFFEVNRRKFFPIILLWTVAAAAVLLVHFDCPSLWYRLYPESPPSLIMSLPTIYLSFLLAEFVNKKFPNALEKFNGFADVSYISMLIQHIIIFIIVDRLDLQNLQMFGLIYIFFLITVLIVYTSRFIKKFSDALENYFLKRKGAIV